MTKTLKHIGREDIYLKPPFLSLRRENFSFEQFNGEFKESNHFVLEKNDAVCVTLFDAFTDCFLFVEQFRSGAAINVTENNPWMIEPVAGHIDPGEDPEAAAKRETLEEAEIVCDSLVLLCKGFTSPGILSEIHYHFLGTFDSSKVDVSKSYGLDNEDIKLHVIHKDKALEMVRNGEIRSGNTIIGITMALLTL